MSQNGVMGGSPPELRTGLAGVRPPEKGSWYFGYLRALAIAYFAGFVLHLLDVMGLRLNFASMSRLWQGWVLFLLCGDLVAAAGLWLRASWGIRAFLSIATAQLVAYLGFPREFGDQRFLIGFHGVTLSIFLLFRLKLWREDRRKGEGG
ncbi:MAG: DUF6163 family protein [Oligoflexia bacterium]|nr:DUF6163 family protein [Oligoflexia bacterium]